MKFPKKYNSLLCCPVCKGALRMNEKSASCPGCKKKFVQRKGIFDFRAK